MMLWDIFHGVGGEQRHPLLCRLRMERLCFQKLPADIINIRRENDLTYAIVTDTHCKSIVIDSVYPEAKWSCRKHGETALLKG